MGIRPGDIIGVFIGLDSSSYEYLASIIAPFQQEYIPTVGGFMLIDNINEYIVARIMDYVPKGEMTSSMGIKWLSDVALTPELIGQDIKTKKVSYEIKIKLLGRIDKDLKEFSPGIRKIPHITSKVIKPNTEIVKVICNQALSEMQSGIEIGKYFLDKNIKIHFDIKELIGKRTFIFARAGYGKSNLMKVIASNWKNEYGSLIIFDPEGEYAVTDKENKPGIMDKIPAILITNRKAVRNEIKNNVYDNLKIDLRKLPASFIIPILVVESKHETIFFQKLMGLRDNWHTLVDYLYEHRWLADYDRIAEIMNLSDTDSIKPILNNLVPPIIKLHHPDSKLFDILDCAVKKGIPIIIDIALLDSRSALQLASIIIGHFFRKNQEKFIGGNENLEKIVFVMEEAQSVIGGSNNVAKFVELAKEGRKYQLGCIFITQQPGSISKEILSQGDNFFVFHLLSKGDLRALQEANAHYSNDILTQILNEPVKGKAYMWTSNQPFVLPVQIINFEEYVEPNQAEIIQKNNNLLNQIFSTITQINEIEHSIIIKLSKVLKQLEISLYDPQSIENNIRAISRNLFSMLDGSEIEFLDSKSGLAKNESTNKPYGIHFPYLKNLINKARIFFSENT
ncbi:MAG: ATP-binding protein [Candidatus Helarchaeota archaeon]